MDKYKHAFCVLLSFFVASCATCTPFTTVKSTAQTTSKDFKIINTLIVTEIEFANKVTLSITNCFAKHTTEICASIKAPPGTKIRLDTNEVIATQISGQTTVYKIGSITYDYTCLTKPEGKRICESSEESPTGYPVEIVRDEKELVPALQYAEREFHERSFAPTMEFVGAAVKPYALSRIYFQDYRFTLINAELLGTPPIKVQIPNIWVDGHKYVLPEIGFETVTEDYCHRPELM